MAYTATLNGTTVHGNERVLHYTVSADAASGTVSTGFGTVTNLSWSIKSLSTANIRVRANATAAGTATAGLIGISGAASGDEIYLVVYGR